MAVLSSASCGGKQMGSVHMNCSHFILVLVHVTVSLHDQFIEVYRMSWYKIAVLNYRIYLWITQVHRIALIWTHTG